MSEAVAQLATLERRFRYLFEQARDAFLCVHNDSGKIVGVNPAFEALVGRRIEASESKPSDFSWIALIHPHDRRQAEEMFARHLAGEETGLHRIRLLGSESDPVICDVSLHRRGEARISIFSIRDVTALEEANRKLRESQAMLVQQAKMASLGALVAGVLHEINTPLGAILASADTIARAVEMLPEPRAIAALSRASAATREAGSRIAGFVRTLKRFVHLDEAEVSAADLHREIEGVLEILSHRLTDRIRVVRSYGDLPPFVCRAGQLNQVFMTLIDNAIDAIDRTGTIGIATARAPDGVVVRISDDGRGMDQDQMARIFEPTIRAKHSRAGAGLGLAIALRIVSDHGGSIEVESGPGRGTTFSVRLRELVLPANASAG